MTQIERLILINQSAILRALADLSSPANGQKLIQLSDITREIIEDLKGD